MGGTKIIPDHQNRINSGMTRADLFRMHKDLCRRALTIMQSKNRDYGANEDPFRNFRAHGAYGILVRLSDKIARLTTYIEQGRLSVKDESVTDTGLDVINYSILFLEFIEDAKRREGSHGVHSKSRDDKTNRRRDR